MIELIFTLDYEIYGDGSGDLRQLVYEPTNRLVSLFRERGLSLVVFPDVLELIKIEEYKTDSAINDVKQQLRHLHYEGFEIGLHLHSWWDKARHHEGSWVMDWSSKNLCLLPEEQIDLIIKKCIEYMNELTGDSSFKTIAFRNGLWAMQPSRPLANILAKYGILIDSTLVKGGRIKELQLDYRPSLKNSYYWRFTNDVNIHESDGVLIEIPIYSEMVPFWKMLNRLFSKYRTNQPVNVKQKQDRYGDFRRFTYPRKLDYCKLSFKVLKRTIEKLRQKDREDSTSFKPIVSIGHSKDLVDFETIRRFLDYLLESGIKVTDFRRISEKITKIN